MPDSDTGSESIAVLIPIYNDWDAVQALLPQLDEVLGQFNRPATVILVDDASTAAVTLTDVVSNLQAIGQVVLVSLRRNLGHQRAIAVGLTVSQLKFPHDTLVVMDGDGQDRPEDVPRLVDEALRRGGTSIVFAERRRRSEGIVFTLCYHLYRLAHVLLTGERVRFGNFSAIPRACLDRLVAVSELWSHYAAAVIRSRIPYASIRTTRARRLAGRPQMKFTALAVHGLSALAVFSDVIGVRLLLTSVVIGLVAIVALAVGVPSQLLTSFDAMTGLQLAATAFLLVLVTFGSMLAFTFMILASRQSSQFIPLRDYEYFVKKITTIP